MKHILTNSIKIVLAAIVATLIAQALQLEFAISAGIVAILTIQPTKRETINTALGRLYAFGVALVIAFLSFRVLGFTAGAFFLYLIIFILFCQIFKWYSAMAMNSVLISHFITLQAMNVGTIANEVFIFIIGVSMGIFANLHLHKRTKDMERLEKAAEEQIVKILSRMSERIQNKDISDYNGACFKELEYRIHAAKSVARENYNNQLDDGDTFDMEYIAMRERQCVVLYEMYKQVRELNTSPITAGKISEFLKKTADVFEKGNDCKVLLEEFQQMDLYMDSQPLPTNREEFEDRARLFGLMRSMEEFLSIKLEFVNEKSKQSE